MSLSGGLLAGYWIAKGDPFWTYSSGLAGIICASAGNDLYHPIQAMLIGAIGVVIAYKMHYWVERKFKIDDAVGAVAVHGYAGFVGLVICGFVFKWLSFIWIQCWSYVGRIDLCINQSTGTIPWSNYNVRSSWNATRLCLS